MKMVKTLLLGSAAGFVAIAGAQAADLPVKAKPVEYVKVCRVYGAGFYYIPGTDTCLKVGGFVRAEYNINAGGSHTPVLAGERPQHPGRPKLQSHAYTRHLLMRVRRPNTARFAPISRRLGVDAPTPTWSVDSTAVRISTAPSSSSLE